MTRPTQAEDGNHNKDFVTLAMIHLMLNRLEPKGVDAEFQYHMAA